MIEDIEISENLAEFHRIRKHYLILTDAGKPVYSRYGDEQILAPFFATMSAVIPKMQNYFWDGSVDARQNQNRLHVISSKHFKCHLLKKGSLIYICLVNLNVRASNGGYFLDDLHNMPSFYEKPKHILEEELMPAPVRETASYLQLQLEYLHL
jgi:hypothetical protein